MLMQPGRGGLSRQSAGQVVHEQSAQEDNMKLLFHSASSSCPDMKGAYLSHEERSFATMKKEGFDMMRGAMTMQ